MEFVASFVDAVNKISEVQNEMYMHSSLSFLETLKERHKSMPKESKSDSTYDSFGLSYQPLMKSTYIDEEMEKTAKSIWYNKGSSSELPFIILDSFLCSLASVASAFL